MNEELCKNCIWRVILDDGWTYCSLNGLFVGDSDYCSLFWNFRDFLDFVNYAKDL